MSVINPTARNDQTRRLRFGLMALLSVALLVPGCASEESAKLEDYFEELEFERPLEAVKEIKVNSYRLPARPVITTQPDATCHRCGCK